LFHAGNVGPMEEDDGRAKVYRHPCSLVWR